MRPGLAALAAVGLAIGFGASAIAADDLTGCYARTYDPAHLAAHAGQRVTALAVRVTKATDPSAAATADVTAKLKGSPWTWVTGGDCKPQAGALLCDFQETGAAARLSRQGGGLRMAAVGSLVLDAEGHETGGGERTLATLSTVEDGLFLLTPAPAAACE